MSDDGEQRIRELLGDVMTPDGITVWMTSENIMLGRRTPRQMLREGEYDEVERVVRMLRDGGPDER